MVKRKILVVGTAVASSLAFQIAGQPVYSVSSPDIPSYPAASRQVCEESFGGTFATEPGARTCTVESPEAGKTMYAAFGWDRVEWVQTVGYGLPSSASGDVALGPSSVGCARPDGATNDDWAISCM